MWANFYRDGGWGMIPTSILGFFLIAAAVLYLLRPERRHARLTATLAAVTVGAGLLGTATGLINTFRFVQKVPVGEQVQIAMLGCAESMNNLVLALLIAVVAGLLAAVAGLRRPKDAAV